MSNHIIVYDKWDTYEGYGIGVIQNAIDVRIYEKLNDVWTLDFALPITDEKFELIKEGNYVKVDGQLYIIRNIEESRSESNELMAEIHCEHVFYELMDDYIPSIETFGTAQLVLEQLLAGTRFTADATRVSGSSQFTVRKANPIKGINHMIALWGCEVKPNNFTVGLYEQLGNDYGVQFRYRKNLRSIKKTTDGSGVITRLYVYGKDDLAIPPIDSQYINNYPRPKVSEITFSEIITEETLQRKGEEYLAKHDTPKVSYEVDIVELKSLAEYGIHETFELGDVITVIDEELGIDVNARIVEYERYPFEPERSKVTLANFLPNVADYISQLQDTKRVVDDITYQGKVNTYFLDGIIDVLSNRFVSAESNWHTDEQGNIIFEAMDGTSVMKLAGEGLAIANQKDTHGNWIWSTFGTGDGFTADRINTGVLQAALVKIIADNATYIDGNGIHIVDNNGVERVTLGNYADGKYGIKVDKGFIEIIGGLSADNIDATDLQVQAANVLGKLIANQIDATDLKVEAVNITGQLKANQIDATNLNVQSANISGVLNAEQINLKGTDITAVNGDYFRIGTDGRLYIKGSIVMGAGSSISWANVSDKPSIPTRASDIGAKDASYTAVGELGNTYLTNITSNGVYTGTVQADKLIGRIATVASTLKLGDSSASSGQAIIFNSSCSIDNISGTDAMRLSALGSIILESWSGDVKIRKNGVDYTVATKNDINNVVAKFG